jgi:hypothetical protein
LLALHRVLARALIGHCVHHTNWQQRFGRVSELPGEDPVLTGAYAVEMVRGMQQGESYPRYLKVGAALKHFTACERLRSLRAVLIACPAPRLGSHSDRALCHHTGNRLDRK